MWAWAHRTTSRIRCRECGASQLHLSGHTVKGWFGVDKGVELRTEVVDRGDIQLQRCETRFIVAPATHQGHGKTQGGHRIEVSALYIAEGRGYVEVDLKADWLAAETEIDRLLRKGRLGRGDDDPSVSASVGPAPATR